MADRLLLAVADQTDRFASRLLRDPQVPILLGHHLAASGSTATDTSTVHQIPGGQRHDLVRNPGLARGHRLGFRSRNAGSRERLDLLGRERRRDAKGSIENQQERGKHPMRLRCLAIPPDVDDLELRPKSLRRFFCLRYSPIVPGTLKPAVQHNKRMDHQQIRLLRETLHDEATGQPSLLHT